MIYRTPAELPNEHPLYLPIDYTTYKPITDLLFQGLFPSSEFPGQEMAKVEDIDTSS